VVLVAAAVSTLGALIVVRALPSRPGASIHAPTSGDGRIVFGRSAAGLDQRSLFTVADDGSHEQRLPITYTDCGEWSPDGSLLHVTASVYPGAPLRPAIVHPDGSGFTILDTAAPSDLNLGCGDWSPDGVSLVLEGFGPSPAVDGIYIVNAKDGADLARLTHGHDYVPQFSPT
jgi:hypothetical protein